MVKDRDEAIREGRLLRCRSCGHEMDSGSRPQAIQDECEACGFGTMARVVRSKAA